VDDALDDRRPLPPLEVPAAAAMTAITITPRGPFSLAAAERFFGRWEATSGTESAPASAGASAPDSATTPGPASASAGIAGPRDDAAAEAAGDDRAVNVAFLVDDWSGAAGLTVRQREADGPVEIEIVSGTFADPARVLAQVQRVFSLDHDAGAYAEIGERDAVIGARQRESGFLRPVLFHSPYEAACWTILSARTHHAQARKVRAALSDRLEVAGVALDVFAAPVRLLEQTDIPGLNAEKVTRLHGIARAALEGRLDRDRLLALEPEAALEELRDLRGIGPFSSALILLRGVGPTDGVAPGEPRMRRAVAAAYARPELERDDDAFVALAETWRPFRTWVSVLMRATAPH
jgi:DNA-3-methyladenine glycosylase II